MNDTANPAITEPEGQYPRGSYLGAPLERIKAKLNWYFEQGRVENLSFSRAELEVLHEVIRVGDGLVSASIGLNHIMQHLQSIHTD